MRYASLVACLMLATAATATAAPWSKFKPRLPFRSQSSAQKWADERELGPYLIRSEFPLADVQDLVHDLGDLQRDIEQLLELQCNPQAIEIHLFASKSSYEQYVKVHLPQGVKRQALFVPDKDALRVFAYRHAGLDVDVRHETTHALLHTALPYVPIWIDEGIAEYFEVSDGLRKRGNPHRKELQNAIRYLKWKPNIEQLESKRKLVDMGAKDYRDSWGIIHFLLNGPPEAQESLGLYFEEIQSGAAPTPLSVLLRQRIPDLDQAIIDHLMR